MAAKAKCNGSPGDWTGPNAFPVASSALSVIPLLGSFALHTVGPTAFPCCTPGRGKAGKRSNMETL